MEKPIDFVVTWVDGSDPAWQQEKAEWEAREKGGDQDELFASWFNSPIRYRDWGTFPYWFRGVEKFAPWVHKVYLLTWGHVPEWLNLDNPKLCVVNHKEFIPEKYLPTFNSHTIEWNMHRIPGLSEQFVYFNDDVFLTRMTRPEDFFKNGLPCETAALDCIAMDWNIGHAEIKNTQILNKYFKKRPTILAHWKKWFCLIYGKQLIKTIALMPWDQFTGMYESHLAFSYLKSTFDTVWEKEGKTIDSTCQTKFRDSENISHWLVKNWQLVTGMFSPRSPRIGRMYLQQVDTELCESLKSQKYKIMCINDIECSEAEFQKQRAMLISAFESILPGKSSFER